MSLFDEFNYVCTRCRKGVVMARSIERPCDAPYVFRCTCDRGRAEKRNFPEWQQGDSTKYEILQQVGG